MAVAVAAARAPSRASRQNGALIKLTTIVPYTINNHNIITAVSELIICNFRALHPSIKRLAMQILRYYQYHEPQVLPTLRSESVSCVANQSNLNSRKRAPLILAPVVVTAVIAVAQIYLALLLLLRSLLFGERRCRQGRSAALLLCALVPPL